MKPNSIEQAIGLKLRAARIQAGKTQADVAAVMGVKHQAYQKYELGEVRMTLGAFLLACAELGTEPASILPRLMNDRTPAPDPFAAMGASIGGYELADCYARVDDEQRRSILSVAKAFLSTSTIRSAAA